MSLKLVTLVALAALSTSACAHTGLSSTGHAELRSTPRCKTAGPRPRPCPIASEAAKVEQKLYRRRYGPRDRWPW